MSELSQSVSTIIISKLRSSLSSNGKASLMLSGGSTPRATYSLLGQSDLNWQHVDIGLVDDRWVAPTSPSSNAAMIRESFLSKLDGETKFHPLKTTSDNLEAGCEAANLYYHKIYRPFTCLVLGMGLDGHTASWFPNANGLENSLNPPSSKIIVPIRPQKSEITGEYLERATLTLSAVNEAKNVYLLISGKEKLRLFNHALTQPHSNLTIRAVIDTLGSRLSVFWTP